MREGFDLGLVEQPMNSGQAVICVQCSRLASSSVSPARAISTAMNGEWAPPSAASAFRCAVLMRSIVCLARMSRAASARPLAECAPGFGSGVTNLPRQVAKCHEDGDRSQHLAEGTDGIPVHVMFRY